MIRYETLQLVATVASALPLYRHILLAHKLFHQDTVRQFNIRCRFRMLTTVHLGARRIVHQYVLPNACDGLRIEVLRPDMMVVSSCYYSSDKRHGCCTLWYNTGQIMSREYYTDNILDDHCAYWYLDGRKMYTAPTMNLSTSG